MLSRFTSITSRGARANGSKLLIITDSRRLCVNKSPGAMPCRFSRPQDASWSRFFLHVNFQAGIFRCRQKAAWDSRLTCHRRKSSPNRGGAATERASRRAVEQEKGRLRACGLLLSCSPVHEQDGHG